jgi:hypothetical protein
MSRRDSEQADARREQEWREEAERLALLPSELQQKALALIRAPAANLNGKDRQQLLERADALERHLRRLNRRKE